MAWGGISPPPTAHSLYEVGINFEALKQGPISLILTLPEDIVSVVPMVEFSPRNGFIYRDEEDPPGTPEFWPDPNAEPEDFSYLWRGRNDEYNLVLTVHNGQLLGKIYGLHRAYGIALLQDEITYWLHDIRFEGYPPMEPSLDTMSQYKPHQSGKEDIATVSNLRHYDLLYGQDSAQNNTTVLDMLIMWTEQARIDAGGDINNPSDTQGLDSLIISSIDNANAALADSLTNTRVTKFHTAKLDNFILTGDPFDDRDTFKNLNSVKDLRTLIGADVVSGIVKNAVSQGDFPVCGVAYVQTHPGCGQSPYIAGCGAGSDFDDFAYSLVAQNCAIFDDTFTHELGHLLGGNHARFQSPPQFPYQGYDGDVINNGFPDPFAHRVDNSFNTIMSISTSPPRQLFFSNPDVNINGTPSGTLGTRNNARIIDVLSPVMSEYRIRPDLIFMNGFE